MSISASKNVVRRTASKAKISKIKKNVSKINDDITTANDFEIQNLRKALRESQNTGDSLMQRLSDAIQAGKQTDSELRNQQYNNMKLQQQLEDERNIYLIEKQQLCDEICSLKHQLGQKPDENRYSKLVVEHHQQICELCINFLKTRNTNQMLRDNFLDYQKQVSEKMAKLNCRIRELAEALTQVNIAGQYSKPYIKASRRYLELHHDNQCLNKQIRLLQIRNYGFTVEECLSLQILKHEMTMTDDIEGQINKYENKTKLHTRKQKRMKKPVKYNLSNNSSGTTIEENMSKTSVITDLISFDDLETESRPHGDGADTNDIAQIEITESTSTSYFTLKRVFNSNDYNLDPLAPINNSHRSPMRTHSAPDIIKAKDFEGLEAKYTCYRKDIGTNT